MFLPCQKPNVHCTELSVPGTATDWVECSSGMWAGVLEGLHQTGCLEKTHESSISYWHSWQVLPYQRLADLCVYFYDLIYTSWDMFGH